ncbi:MAG TPA: hypothetical protein ENJ32_11715 [Crenotrichaceae bacterium]|nr:hypothetical protein [Crenotrichaceae bacterium]
MKSEYTGFRMIIKSCHLLVTLLLASLSMVAWSAEDGTDVPPTVPEQTQTPDPNDPGPTDPEVTNADPANPEPTDSQTTTDKPVDPEATPVDQSPVAEPSGREINSTYSGLWFDPARNGEGFALVISETTAGSTMVVSYYTYDDQKQTIFLIGSQALPSGTTSVTVPVIITSGASFGNSFKSADVVKTPAGTISFTFTSCNTGVVDYNLNTLGSGSLSVVRLLGVEDLDCS